MANKRIQGITVEIGGDSLKLQKALQDVDKQISKTQGNLKDINKLLKLDPGNTELLTQKQKNLQESIKATEDRLKTLKSTQTDSLSPEQYDALQREIIETEQNLKKLTEEYKNFGSVGAQQLQVAGDKIKAFGNKMSTAGTALTKYVTGPLMALGAGAVAAYDAVDEGADKILVATGASGEALADMEERMKSLATSIPTDFGTAGDAIGAVNTRFGITGDALEELSGQYIKFAKLNGTDVTNSVNSTQKALTAFGKSSKSAGKYLDVLTKVGQDTGIAVDKLNDGVTANASSFQAMGMDLYQAATFMGKIEKSGADVSAVFSGLGKATKLAAKENKSMNSMLMDFQKKVKSGKKDAEAMTLAYEMFGKSGAQVFNAVKSGAIDFGDLASSAENLGNVVSDSFEATLDPADRFQTAMNAVKVTGAEIASVAMPAVSVALDKVRDIIMKARDAWNGLSEDTKKAILIVGSVAAAIGPILAIGGKLVSGIGGAVGLLGKFAGALHIAAGPAVAVVAAVGVLAAVFVKLWKTNDRFRNKIVSMWQLVKKKTLETVDSLKTGFEGIKKRLEPVIVDAKQIWQKFTDFMGRVFQAGSAQIANTILTIQYIFRDLGKVVSGLISGDFSKVGEAFKHIGDVIKRYAEVSVEWFKWIFQNINWAELGTKVLNGLKSAFEGIKEFATNAFTAVRGLVSQIDWKVVGTTIWNAITSAIGTIGGWLKDGYEKGKELLSSVDWAAIGSTVWGTITGAIGTIGGWLKDGYEASKTALAEVDWAEVGSTVWSTITSAIGTVGGWLRDGFEAGKTALAEVDWAEVGSTVWGTITSAIGTVGGWLRDGFEAGKTALAEVDWAEVGSTVWGTITGAIGTIGGWLRDGYTKGIEALAEVDWAEVGSTIWALITGAIGTVGGWLKDGYTKGIEALSEVDWAEVGSTIWTLITGAIGTVGGWLKDGYSAGVEALSEVDWPAVGSTIWGLITGAIGTIGGWIKDGYDAGILALSEVDWSAVGSSIWTLITGAMGTIGGWLKDGYEAGMTALAEVDWPAVGSSIWTLITGAIGTIGGWLKAGYNAGAKALTEVKWSTFGSAIWSLITGAIGTIGGWIKDGYNAGAKALTEVKWSAFGSAIWTLITGAIGTVGDYIASKWEDTKKAIAAISWKDLGTTIWEGIKSAFADVKQFFTDMFDFSNIHIKLPHITVTSWKSLGPINVPWGWNVSWYRKAYDNPVMFTQPTVLQTPAGPKGFGDGPGGEVVLSMAKLKELVGSGAGEQTFNFTINAQPGQSAEDIAAAVKRVFVREMEQRSAAYA